MKILLIEDDLVDQMAFKRFITNEHILYDLTIAGSVLEAKSILRSQKFDCIVADYLLGDGTAFDIFDLTAGSPVILITGMGSEEVAVNAMKGGAYDYLLKDNKHSYLSKLPVVITNAIDRKRLNSQYKILSHAIMNITDSVYITDKNNRIIFVNNAFCNTYLYEEKEIIGKPGAILWKEETVPCPNGSSSFNEFMSDTTGEYYHKKKNENIFPVWLSLSTIKNVEDDEIYFVGIVRDITKRKELEDSLQYSIKTETLISTISTQFINLLPEEVDEGINSALKALGTFAGVDLSCVYFFTENLESITLSYEWCAEGIQSSIDIMKKIQTESLEWFMKKMKRLESIYIHRVVDLLPEASIEKEMFQSLHVQSLLVVPIVRSNHLMGCICFGTVQRERIWRVEDEVLLKTIANIFVNALSHFRSEKEIRKLYLAIKQSPTVVMITDREGNIDYVNLKFSSVSGYKQEEIMGKNPRFLKSGETSPEEYSRMWEIITSGGEWRGVFHNKKKNGELYWESAAISPIRDEKGTITHFLALKEDITRRKKMEELLVQSEKMAAIGTLAAGLAHEINNPIGYILSNLNYMLKYNEKLSNYHNIVKGVIDRYSKDKLREAGDSIAAITQTQQDLNLDYVLTDMKNAISESLEGAEKIKKIVSDLKDFSRAGKPEMKYSNINEGIEKILSVVWNELKYKAEVVKEFGEIPEIECDIQQLHQVFLNLLLNAAQAIENKGVIKITTSQENNWIVIKISDTGKGIPENIRDNIFDAFFTTKDPGKGTGLGLSVAYRIIRSHSGTITVESEVGKGTTFIIRLPIKMFEPITEKKVLIVDDEESVRNTLVMLVNKFDKTIFVKSTSSGSEALNLLDTFKPDVILTDIIMPGMNGFEFCSKINETELKDEIKIVMFTGYDEEGLKEKCLEAGAVEYFTKPIQAEKIFRILDRVLNG